MFKPGDVVQLKSGSPLMTVSEIVTDRAGVNKVVVSWFDNNEPKNSHFVAAMLEPYKESSGDIGDDD